MPTVIIDNGAYTAKCGLATDAQPRVMPNCVIKAKNVRTRVFVGDQIEDCRDLSGLYYLLAYQKGYLINWDIQRQVWDHIFSKAVLNVPLSSTDLVITEPYFNFTSVQESMNEVFFEEYQLNSILRCNVSSLCEYKCQQERPSELCSLIVDSGYSFTHIVPYYNGKKLKQAVRRINIGGKILTNHLKEIVSYRQLMVMDETHVMNQCKEDVCYVSQDFFADMVIAKKRGAENTVVRDYVLPDYTHIKRGYIRSLEQTSTKSKGTEQIIRMNNERFCIPEILFHPSDVGVQEMGIPESIVHAVSRLPEEMHAHLYKNIWLTGGNCTIPGFKERFEKEIRALVPDEMEIVVNMAKNPITFAWEGGHALASDAEFREMLVTRQDFEEHGQNICLEKFDL